MADKRISALTAAATLDKTEVFPIVQGGVTVKATIAQALAPLTILQSDAGTMLAGVPAYPVDGQVYLLTSLGITGVDHIRTVGIVDANTADFVFNNNCEAYLDGLGVYVPCTYDVATNKISAKIPVYAINLTQTAGGDVNTVNKTFTNLLGETPVITKDSDGVININTTTFAFTQYQVGLFAPAIYDSGSTSLFVPTLAFIDANNLRVSMTKASDGTAVDDIYNNTYLEFYILIAN